MAVSTYLPLLRSPRRTQLKTPILDWIPRSLPTRHASGLQATRADTVQLPPHLRDWDSKASVSYRHPHLISIHDRTSRTQAGSSSDGSRLYVNFTSNNNYTSLAFDRFSLFRVSGRPWQCCRLPYFIVVSLPLPSFTIFTTRNGTLDGFSVEIHSLS